MPTSSRPHLRVEEITGITIVTFADSSLVAEEVIFEVNEELTQMVEHQGVTRLVLDFRDVRLMSSAMVAELVRIQRKLAKGQGSMKLCGLIPSLREVFRAANLDRLFPIHDGVHAALDAF